MSRLVVLESFLEKTIIIDYYTQFQYIGGFMKD